MTRDDLISQLAAIERHLENRVELWRVIIDMDGTVRTRIYRCSFTMPAGWKSPPPPPLTMTARDEPRAHARTDDDDGYLVPEEDTDV